jgi:hypothetical protein
MKAIELIIAFALSMGTLLSACSSSYERLGDGVEQASESAPDGLSRAFVWAPKSSGTLGATSSQPYQVWIQFAKFDKPQALILKVAETDGVVVKWAGPRVLEICYGPSHIYYFNNIFDQADQVTRQLYRVEIQLRRVQSKSECK